MTKITLGNLDANEQSQWETEMAQQDHWNFDDARNWHLTYYGLFASIISFIYAIYVCSVRTKVRVMFKISDNMSNAEAVPLTGQPVLYAPVPQGEPIYQGVFWKAGIFDCLESFWPNTLMAMFCPCVSLAQIASRVGIYGGYTRVLIVVFVLAIAQFILKRLDANEKLKWDYNALRNWHVTYYGLLSAGITYINAIFVCSVRTKIRVMFKIQGSECEDFMCSLFCACCTIAQMSTQVGSYTQGQCRFGPADTLPAYTSMSKAEAAPLTGQRAPIPQGEQLESWNAGVFDCFESFCPNTLMALFCPCVSLAQIASRVGIYGGYTRVLVIALILVIAKVTFAELDLTKRLKLVQQNNYSQDLPYYSLISWIIALIYAIYVCSVRTKIRVMFKIQGSECEDFMCSLFCGCCTIAQMSTQVGSYTKGQCRFGPADTLPAYTPPMAVPMQPQMYQTTASPVVVPLPLNFWRVGVFEIADCYPNGLMAWCCPCVALAQITSRLGIYGGYYRVLYTVALLLGCGYIFSFLSESYRNHTNDYESNEYRAWASSTHRNSYAVLSTLCFLAIAIFTALVRTRIRALHRLEGTEMEDFACAFACTPCTIAQMATEVGSYEQGVMSKAEAAPLTGQPVLYAPIPQGEPVHQGVFWKAGIFDCLESFCPNTLMAWCCPCVSLAQIASRVGIYGGYTRVLVVAFILVVAKFTLNNLDANEQSQWETEVAQQDHWSFDDVRNWHLTYFGLFASIISFIYVIFIASVRTKIRVMFKIPGSECEDFLCSCFCGCCTIAQMSTQVGSYTQGQCRFGPADTLPAYTV
ncbi:PLAC8 family protein [Thraustotheca clavata]|uniref:PLAC8 family protein n=1 Tax=Thraustotheca clavata TaxID=74557 RepID=A0A1W0A927_9STRA|nr:PLAC8 family protein [Thraustotheca clavata]